MALPRAQPDDLPGRLVEEYGNALGCGSHRPDQREANTLRLCRRWGRRRRRRSGDRYRRGHGRPASRQQERSFARGGERSKGNSPQWIAPWLVARANHVSPRTHVCGTIVRARPAKVRRGNVRLRPVRRKRAGHGRKFLRRTRTDHRQASRNGKPADHVQQDRTAAGQFTSSHSSMTRCGRAPIAGKSRQWVRRTAYKWRPLS